MAAAAPPQSASDCEMKGTSRIESGRADGWALAGTEQATHTRTTATHAVLVCGLLFTTWEMTVKSALVHSHDYKDQHQQGDDDHGRRDHHFRLSPGQRLFHLMRLCGHRAELLCASSLNGTRRTAQIDPGT